MSQIISNIYMDELKNIKTIIFDFGGTLDTDGIHWSEMFWKGYKYFNIPVDKNIYSKAYRNAETNVEKHISGNTSFYDTLFTQVSFQFEYLTENDLLPKKQWAGAIKQIVDYCYNYTVIKINESKILLQLISKSYSLGLVSNFYGNISAVLSEFEIDNYFNSIVDSSEVGISKPDPKIFEIAILELNENFENTVVIGDSYSRDIEPAKKLGCSTIWLDGKSWSRPNDIKCADYIIHSIIEIKNILSI